MNVLKKNFKEIVEAIKDPIFYRVLIFLALTGTIPSFGTFGYYFMLDVVKLSKFTIALLNVLGYVSLMLGSALFNSVFNKKRIQHPLHLQHRARDFVLAYEPPICNETKRGVRPARYVCNYLR